MLAHQNHSITIFNCVKEVGHVFLAARVRQIEAEKGSETEKKEEENGRL